MQDTCMCTLRAENYGKIAPCMYIYMADGVAQRDGLNFFTATLDIILSVFCVPWASRLSPSQVERHNTV